MGTKMLYEELSYKLYDEVVLAGNSLRMFKNFYSYCEKYSDVTITSPESYLLIINTMFANTYMTTAKLFDNTVDNSIGKLLSLYEKNIASLCSKNKDILYPDLSQREKKIAAAKNMDILQISDLVKLYQLEMHALNNLLEKLRNMRNRIFAHNTNDAFWNRQEFFKQSELEIEDFEELLKFAANVCGVVVVYCDNRFATFYSAGIDDFETTLKLAQYGLEIVKERDRKWEKEALGIYE